MEKKENSMMSTILFGCAVTNFVFVAFLCLPLLHLRKNRYRINGIYFQSLRCYAFFFILFYLLFFVAFLGTIIDDVNLGRSVVLAFFMLLPVVILLSKESFRSISKLEENWVRAFGTGGRIIFTKRGVGVCIAAMTSICILVSLNVSSIHWRVIGIFVFVAFTICLPALEGYKILAKRETPYSPRKNEGR